MKRLAYRRTPMSYFLQFLDFIDLKCNWLISILTPFSQFFLFPVYVFFLLISLPFYLSETHEEEKNRKDKEKIEKNILIKKYNKNYKKNIPLIK